MGEDLGAPLGAKKTSDAKYSKPGEEVRLGKWKERQVTVYLPSSWSEELLSKKKKKKASLRPTQTAMACPQERLVPVHLPSSGDSHRNARERCF